MYVVHESWTDMHCRVHLVECSIYASSERHVDGQWHQGYESMDEAMEAAKAFARTHRNARFWNVGLCHICCGASASL